MPDIDIDFCTRGRGEVIQYVTEKYGREQVAQIITFGTLGARAAIKDVGRALDLSFADVDRITKLIPSQPLNIKIKEARKMEPQLDELAARSRASKKCWKSPSAWRAWPATLRCTPPAWSFRQLR